MRHLSILVALVAGCGTGESPARSSRYITIGTDALATARDVAAHDHARFELVEEDGEVAVLAIEDRELEALSEQMHAQHDRCGGFMVHESLADARAAARDTPLDRRVDYSIDHPEVVRAVLPELDRTRILATIGELSAMPNRYYQSSSGAAASTWLRDRWRSFTTRREVTVELVDHGYAQQSVILTIPGTTRPSEVIVIGGHLDSIAPGGKASNAPGADDDASGIATLTEVARVLLVNDVRPARTIKLIAYAAEEVGLRGSLSLARDFKKRGVDVIGAMQLDMTNYQGSDKDIWLMSDYTSAAQNAFVGTLIDTYVGATWGFDKCGYACSDHAAWHRAGVPASMPFESRSKEMNRKIHTRNDTLETSGNNADHAVKFARLAAAYAIELGKGELGAGDRHAPDSPDHLPEVLAFGLLGLALVLARRIGP